MLSTYQFTKPKVSFDGHEYTPEYWLALKLKVEHAAGDMEARPPKKSAEPKAPKTYAA